MFSMNEALNTFIPWHFHTENGSIICTDLWCLRTIQWINDKGIPSLLWFFWRPLYLSEGSSSLGRSDFSSFSSNWKYGLSDLNSILTHASFQTFLIIVTYYCILRKSICDLFSPCPRSPFKNYKRYFKYKG